MISQSRVHRAVEAENGAISLELCLLWLYLVLHLMGGMDQGIHRFAWRAIVGIWKKTLKKAMYHTPILTLDRIILGKELPLWQDGSKSFGDPSCKFWDDKDVLC